MVKKDHTYKRRHNFPSYIFILVLVNTLRAGPLPFQNYLPWMDLALGRPQDPFEVPHMSTTYRPGAMTAWQKIHNAYLTWNDHYVYRYTMGQNFEHVRGRRVNFRRKGHSQLNSA